MGQANTPMPKEIETECLGFLNNDRNFFIELLKNEPRPSKATSK